MHIATVAMMSHIPAVSKLPKTLKGGSSLPPSSTRATLNRCPVNFLPRFYSPNLCVCSTDFTQLSFLTSKNFIHAPLHPTSTMIPKSPVVDPRGTSIAAIHFGTSVGPPFLCHAVGRGNHPLWEVPPETFLTIGSDKAQLIESSATTSQYLRNTVQPICRGPGSIN